MYYGSLPRGFRCHPSLTRCPCTRVLALTLKGLRDTYILWIRAALVPRSPQRVRVRVVRHAGVVMMSAPPNPTSVQCSGQYHERLCACGGWSQSPFRSPPALSHTSLHAIPTPIVSRGWLVHLFSVVSTMGPQYYGSCALSRVVCQCCRSSSRKRRRRPSSSTTRCRLAVVLILLQCCAATLARV